MSKVILITGTSTGLGVAIAAQAARAGHRVYASMRDPAKRAALDATRGEAPLTVLPLDVLLTSSVDAAVGQVMAQEGRIDTLINNAGAGFVRTTEQASEEDAAWVMDVNFHGVVRCTKAVLPPMRAAGGGHIINITSVGGLVGQPFNEFYCAAKFAVEGYTEALASYVTPAFGVRFTCVEPGGISTEFANNVLAQLQSSGGMLEDEYLPLLQKYIGGAQSRQGEGIYQTADDVAEVVMGCVDAADPPIRCRTSAWSEEFTQLKTGLDPDGKKQQADVIARFMS